MKKERKILFVDDDPDMLEIGGIIIKRAGYDYVSAISGPEGLAAALKHAPDLVVLDYYMPGMNGFEFLEQFVSNPDYSVLRETSVIMLTAASESDVDRHALFELGLSAFLMKPFGNRELLNIIDNVFIQNDLRLKNKELKEQVKRTEYKYQDLIENASDLIFTLNPQARLVFINRRFQSITGFEKQEWLERSFFELIVQEDRADAERNFEKTINGKSSIFEVMVLHANGAPICLSININPIFNKGKVVGCVAIARNITEKKQLEQEIIELKNFNESIIQGMGSGLMTIDLDHKITSFNNGASEILGITSEQVLQEKLEDVFSKDDCDRLLMNIDDPEQGLLNREMELKSRNGHSIFVGFSVTPRFDTQNRRVGTIISFKDITQIKQMQFEVQRMDRLASMGVLASGIAHEIRNPLAGIKTIAQTLELEIDPDDARREYIARIVRQVNRMDDLLKTFFSYAKPRQPRREHHRLQEIVHEVTALVENRMRGQSVSYAEHYDPDLPLVHVDYYQIQQIFVNLYLNALDAMPNGGELKLEASPKIATLSRVDRRGQSFPIKSKSSLYVEVLLKDTGEGIEADVLPSIFNPFFTTKPQGAGLGLSIVYRIMTEHQGDIQVESESGKGTVFRVLLPTED